jgi:virginiamycin B lyase
MTPAGVVTEFALDPPYTASPQVITAGPDGALWFTKSTGAPARTGDAIGRITLAGAITQFALPTGANPQGITAGPDGAVWFTELGANQIGRITLSGAVREFPIPYPDSSQQWGIVAGPDHALWFTEKWGPILGRVTVSGNFTDLGVTIIRAGGEEPEQPYDPREIIVGPDGDLWFSELAIHEIGHYVFTPPTPAPAAYAMATVHCAKGPQGGPHGAVALSQAEVGCSRSSLPPGSQSG